jgi:uncharacterized caspase-like protein
MLRHVKAAAAAASLFAIIACSPAFAENRVALVIGNSAYRAVTPLPNAENDARGMAEMLGAAGFEVTAAPDLSQDDLRKTVAEFAGKLAAKGPDTVALVFYAGHGIQVDGENFIVPVDIDPKREADVPLQAVRLNDVLNTLNSVPNKMRIVMLDACRNNPFPAINQTTGRGLAMVDTKSGAPGTFISYSTSPGSEAEDGTGVNSPYTTALMKIAREPGLPIEEAFKRVRVSVNDATQGRQVPWESSSLTTDFRFFGGDGLAAGTQQASLQPGATAAARPVATRSVEEWRRELQGKDADVAYRLVIAEDTVEAYQAYIALFPQAPFTVRVKLLKDRREEMVAWNTTVIINTVASFRSFTTTYPGSDLAATARKLEERIRNRSLNANAALIPAPLQAAVAPPAPAPNATPIPASLPTNVATAPAMCPCTVAPPVKRTDTKPPVKRADVKPTIKRPDSPPPRRVRPPTDDDVVVYAPPPRVYVPPPRIGGGIYIGGGGGMGRPGYHQPPPMRGGSMPPMRGGTMPQHYR